jgi:predicted nucleic acid-binding protein
MTVIDTCILSSLAKIDRLDLLPTVFRDIITTPSVLNEIEKTGEAKFVKRIKESVYFDEIGGGEFIFVVPLSQKELQYAHKLKTEYGLSIADSECIAVAKMRKMILLSDDKYLGKMAINEGAEHVYDFLTFLEACILKGIIQKDELIEIVSLLKKRDFYEFSDNDKRELFSYFELKGER